MESQNCWEPVIHEKEGVINAFVKEALDSLEERLMRTAEGASDEYMVKLEEEEYAKAVKILTVVTTKRYARLAKGNVRNFQERTARTVYGSRYIAWAGYSFSVQVILTTSF